MMKESELLRDFFLDRLERDSACEAIYDYNSKIRYTYGDLNDRSKRLANYLLSRGGVHRGDRVAICAENCIQYFDLFYTMIRTGTIMTSYNGRLTVHELQKLMEQEEPAVLFFSEEYRTKIEEIKRKLPLIKYVSLDEETHMGDFGCYTDVLAEENHDPGYVDVAMDDIYMLIHTGGSTGLPKGAMLSYATFYHSVEIQVASYRFCGMEAAYMCMPMYHMSALISFVFPTLYTGGRLILTPKFRADEFYEVLEPERLTYTVGVPSMYRQLINHSMFADADFSHIDRALCGAAPATIDIMEKFWDKGVKIYNAYGITEGSPSILAMPTYSVSMEKLREKQLSVGRPMMHVRLRIVDEDDNDVQQGEKGELLIRAAAMFSGYWKNPEETAKAVKDGWLYTGDIAMQDEEDFYYIVGRKKNMFISHGENIYPIEIEQILETCPGVKEVCVFGIPDACRGEAGMAIIVKEEGSLLDVEEVKSFCKAKLSSIKRPVAIRFVEEIPKNAVGKIPYSQLRRIYGK